VQQVFIAACGTAAGPRFQSNSPRYNALVKFGKGEF
jgi:hypothetical protein